MILQKFLMIFSPSVVSKLSVPCYQDLKIYSDQTENRIGHLNNTKTTPEF